MALIFANRLDIDELRFDVLHGVDQARSYKGSIALYWRTRSRKDLNEVHRADDLRFLRYAFEAGDHFLAYDIGQLAPADIGRVGDVIGGAIRRGVGLAFQVHLQFSEHALTSIDACVLRFKREDDVEHFKRTREFRDL